MTSTKTEGNNDLSQAGGLSDALGLGFVFLQLLLLVGVLHEVDMLPLAYQRVVALAAGGFVVNHLLPSRWRLSFFVLLSIGAMFLVLGTPTTSGQFWNISGIPAACAVLGLGLVLIGICRLPVNFWVRAGLLVVAGVAAGLFRAGVFKSGGLDVIWIILAAMFMFRVIIYLYDVSTLSQRPSWTQSLAYFFLIPNICCTFFPVIDFKTLHRNYYNEAPLAIYQRGTQWMIRGVIQMLLYRYVDQVFSISASSVDSGVDLIRYLVTNSLLYLNVSGQFHVIIGLLLLFGFNLPETNHRYFLATSFTDYWRRVNIYWKDFMMKVFYYPTFFRLKKLGQTQALILATAWVFFITWVLHLYQTWWLKGSASITWPDSLFWLILGVLILINSMSELKRGRKRTLASSTYTWTEAVSVALQTAGTFACICLLWSLWSSPSVSTWLGMWKYADRYTLLGAVGVLAAVMVAKIVMEVLPTKRTQAPAGVAIAAAAPTPPILWRRAVLQCVVPLLAIYGVAHLALQPRVPAPGHAARDPRFALQRFCDVIEAGDSFQSVRDSGELNYYQQLKSLDEPNRQLLEKLIGQAIPVKFGEEMPVTQTSDFRMYTLTPLVNKTAFETKYRSNRWGMRDQDYELEKPAGTLRIALLGSSHTMGWGVMQEQLFKEDLRDELSRNFSPGASFEILNFAVYGYGTLSQTTVLETQARAFKPDIVLMTAHPADTKFDNYILRTLLRRKISIPGEQLQDILRKARISVFTPDGLAEKRLQPYAPEILQWSFSHIVNQSRAMGALPVYAVLPDPRKEMRSAENLAKIAMMLKQASDAGFLVFDLSALFENADLSKLITTGWSPHINAKAHAQIADELYRILTTDPRIDLKGMIHNAPARGSNDSVTQNTLKQ